MKAEEAIATLHEALKDIASAPAKTSQVKELENQCDTLVHMTVDLLRKTFITPFDREEIRTLISTLDDIVDYTEAAAHRLVLFEVKEIPPEMLQLCGVLARAQAQVKLVVAQLRVMKKGERLSTICKEINRLENEGDQLQRAGISALFKNETDAITVIKLKEMYEVMENAIDTCEDVANVVEGIIIEHGREG